MEDFSRWLKQAEIADLGASGAPGGLVVLPWGSQILHRFGTLVRKVVAEHGFEEYEFPMLSPESAYSASADLIDLERELLRTEPFGHGARYVLTPTGEQTIYTYWAARLRTEADFPKRVYQRARYFRPATCHGLTGGGVYKAVEAGDVFEFHSTHLDASGSKADATNLISSFAQLAVRMGAAVIWSTRPPWTNRGALYESALAGDAVLPHGVTVQTAVSYHQGQVFSSRYRIGVGQGAARRLAWQADGVISRRMVFAALQQAAAETAQICLHPDLAPIQAAILSAALSGSEREELERVGARLRGLGFRIGWEDRHGGDDVRRALERWCRRSVPIVVLVFGSAGKHARLRVVTRRADNGLEIPGSHIEALSGLIPTALAEIATANDERRMTRLARHIAEVHCETDLKPRLLEGRVVLCPMTPTETHVRLVSTLGAGEVLGFQRTDLSQACIYSGAATTVRAIISRRL